ncbi:hypothetical protein CHELA1G2_11666 [Hyphomicrobiales bacterium]|nr:hypothetical protein CHELA1G2_11666 [Hyphomicrobiales bacterium]
MATSPTHIGFDSRLGQWPTPE